MQTINLQSLIYNCSVCEQDIKFEDICDHSEKIIRRNLGKFAYDDMVMCHICCTKSETWNQIDMRISEIKL